MYRTLFDLAGLAIVAWLLLMLLPTWRVTRWLAETAVFPVFLSILYLVGITAVLLEMGPGIMRDFGSADGVLALLRTEGLALVAWIHILAFDQVVGLLIYRDNMRHRFVALPVQSAMLFLTLMFGPVGFLAYYVARVSNRRSGRVAWGEVATPTSPAHATNPASLRFADVRARADAIAVSGGRPGCRRLHRMGDLPGRRDGSIQAPRGCAREYRGAADRCGVPIRELTEPLRAVCG